MTAHARRLAPTPIPSPAATACPPSGRPHRGTWLSWPHKEAPGRASSARCPASSRRWCAHLADREEVHINVAGPAMEASVPARAGPRGCRRGQRLLPSTIPTNDAWCRDHGPIFVAADRGRPAASRRSSTGATTPGAASIRRTTSTTSIPTPHRRGARAARVRARHRDGGRLHRRQRPRHPAHDRGLPAQPQPQSPADRAEIEALSPRFSRRAPRSSGSATASRATTPTATSTISPASSTSAPS